MKPLSPGKILSSLVLICWAFQLVGCGTGDIPGETASVQSDVTGIVRAPAGDVQQFASARILNFDLIADGITQTALADITGLEPVGFAQVELVRLDDQGNVINVLDTAVSDANGVYSFTNTPTPDSSLAVRVVGQSNTMRAFVTGPEADISPASEVVTTAVVDALDSEVLLGNFEPQEVAALTSLLVGLDINIDGMLFNEAVTTIRNASLPLINDLVTGYSTAGAVTVLQNGLYGGVDFAPALRDPFVVGAGEGGVEIRSGVGGWGFGPSSVVANGNISNLRARHNLSTVEQVDGDFTNLAGITHSAATTGQVIVSDAEDNAVAGAFTSDGSVLIYPLDGSDAGIRERGLRLATRRTVDSDPLDITLLDPGGGGTNYHLVRFRETLSGLFSNQGRNAVGLGVENGTLTFNSDQRLDASGDGNFNSAAMTSSGLTSNWLMLDLDGYFISGGSDTPSELLEGSYQIIPDGSALLRNLDGTFLGQGYATTDGEVLVTSTSSNLIQIELDVLGNDSTAFAGDTLTITDVSTPDQGGSVTVNAAGNGLLYSPPPNITGSGTPTVTQTFTYTVSDGTSSETATVSINHTENNSPPAAIDDSGFNVIINSSNNAINVLANDDDPDLSDNLTVSSVGTPDAGGTAVVNGAGTAILYSPSTGHLGSETFTYTVSDGSADSAPATVTVNTIPSNNTPPVAVDDSGSQVAMGSIDNLLDVLANDTDTDIGAVLTIDDVGNVQAPTAGGTVVVNGTGDGLLYTPPSGYAGDESFSYTISDGFATATATVTVTVLGSGNSAPDAVDDNNFSVAVGSIDNSLDVLVNDFDPDVGDQVTITDAGIDQPPSAGGTVTVSGTGPGNSLLYTPDQSFSGAESFSYTITDGVETDTATVTVTVTGIANSAPVAVNDSGLNVAVDSAGNVINVLANDFDNDIPVQALTVVATGAPSQGGTANPNGGSVLYSPAPAFTGTESFSYTISDGVDTATATVTVNIVSANTPPTAVDDNLIFHVGENSVDNPLAVLANDSDADVGDTLTVNTAGVSQAPDQNGSVSANVGNLLYSPEPGFSGQESFSYTVSDGTDTATATVTVLVHPANTPPVAVDDSGINVAVDSVDNLLAVLVNDSDADVGDTLTITTVGTPDANGSVAINGGADGLLYSPEPGFSGTESFSYTISDGVVSATASVTVTVAGIANSSPVAADDAYTVALNSSNNSLTVLVNDSDPDVGDSLTITEANVSSPLGGGGSVSVNGGSLLYTPPAGTTGTEILNYTISDGTATATASVTVTVSGSNTPPTAVDDIQIFHVSQNSSDNPLAVLANDIDPDVGATLSVASAGASLAPDQGGGVTANGGNLLYSPAPGFSGDESFSYTVSDGISTSTAATVTVTVVSSGNTAPVAVDDGDGNPASDLINVSLGSVDNALDVLANDSDPDLGDTLTITATGTPDAGGTVTINGGADGLLYTPAPAYSGSESFTYTISDGAATATATVTVGVIGAANTVPDAVDDSGINVLVDSVGNVLDVLANDSDADVGDTLTITDASVSTPLGAGGAVSVNGTNDALVYSPPAGATGTEVLSYTISDGIDSATATVSVTVAAANTAPTAGDDLLIFHVDENSTDNPLAVLANDSDPDAGDLLTVNTAGVSQAPDQGGSVTANGGNVLYSPAQGFSGQESFSYTVSDGTDTATATVTVLVQPANTAPAPSDDGDINVAVDSTDNPIDVLANDSDPDAGDGLTVVDAGTVQAPTQGGTVTANGGDVLYSPAPAFSGTESFSYTVSDGVATATAIATVTVGANLAPVPAADSFNVAADSIDNPLAVLANDSDADLPVQGLTVTTASITTPLGAGGAVSVNGTNDGLLYSPPAGETAGSEEISYTVSDGVTTADGTVTVTIGANLAPTVGDDSFSVGRDSEDIPFDVLANDSDADSPPQALTITAASIATPLGAGGTVTINGTSDGLVYTPPAGATGSETLSYTASDGTAGTAGSVTVTVVAPANTGPDAADDSGFNVAQASTNNPLAVLANDNDPDVGDTLTITAAGTPDAGGAVTINGTNDGLVYTPLAGYTGSESFTYTVSDGTATDTATVTVTVVGAGNTAPVAIADGNGVPAGNLLHVDQGSTNNPLDVLANDYDADVGAVLTITNAVVSTPLGSGGTVTINGSSDGLVYTPPAATTGTETLSYTISDGTASASASVTVEVVAANTLPLAVADGGPGSEIRVELDSTDNALAVLANDYDPDITDSLTITQAGVNQAPSGGGTVTVNGTSDGLLYSPAVGFSGDESFSYTISDGAASATATVTVTVVSPSNTPPTAVDDNGFNVALGSSDNLLDVLANDSDPDVGSVLTITATGTTSAGGTVTINGAGPGNSLLYTPAPTFSGSESFSYTISDGVVADTATVTVNVFGAANSAPLAVDDGNINVGVNSTDNPLAVLANDSDPDVGDLLTIVDAGGAQAPTQGGTVTIDGSNLLYTPAASFTGAESFSYTVSDGQATATATVTVNVSATGTAPTANNDTGFRVGQNSTNNPLAVLANDVDPDVGDVLTVTAAGSVQAPTQGGSVTANGSNLLYTPAAGFSGSESFSYTVSDGTATATGTVTVVVVAPENTAPDAIDDSNYRVATTSTDNPLAVLANDVDLDVEDVLTITGAVITTPLGGGGTVAVNATNDGLLYTPQFGVSGTEILSYTISDGTETDTATVTISVVGAGNNPPVAVDDGTAGSEINVQADSAGNPLDVLANDSDPDVSDVLTITAASVSSPLGAGGTVTVNGGSDGLLYSPPAGATGTEILSYTISDGTAEASATVTVSVVAANTAPIAVDDGDGNPPGNVFQVGIGTFDNPIDVLANDRDPDVGDVLSISAAGVSQPPTQGGSVTVNGSNLLYSPAGGFSGSESFSYTISDGTDTATATVTVVILSANTPPVATDDSGLNVRVDSVDNLLDVLANDSDADIGDSLAVTAAGVDQAPTQGGSVTANGGNLLYSPAPGFSGSESFSYTVSDGEASATATVSVNVVSTNTPPSPAADSGFTIAIGSSGNLLNVLVNDIDVDVGDVLTITAVGATSAGGSAAVNGGGTAVLYTPPLNYSGPDSFSYTVSDGTATASATVSVEIADANTAPVAAADSLNVRINSSDNLLSVLANDFDSDIGDLLTITAAGVTTPLGAGGQVTVNGSGDGLLYTPPAGETGTEILSYTVSDGSDEATAEVTLNVSSQQLALTIADDTSWSIVSPADSEDFLDTVNLAEREVGVALRATGSVTQSDVSGVYNVVEYAGYVSADGFGADVDLGYKYGSLTFDGAGGIDGGTLTGRRASLDVDLARNGDPSLSTLPVPSSPETVSSGSYTVGFDGSVTLTLTRGSTSISGSGAVSSSGDFIVVAIRIVEGGVDSGRGLLILTRRP